MGVLCGHKRALAARDAWCIGPGLYGLPRIPLLRLYDKCFEDVSTVNLAGNGKLDEPKSRVLAVLRSSVSKQSTAFIQS
jgi:hypothetical protein